MNHIKENSHRKYFVGDNTGRNVDIVIYFRLVIW